MIIESNIYMNALLFSNLLNWLEIMISENRINTQQKIRLHTGTQGSAVAQL